MKRTHSGEEAKKEAPKPDEDFVPKDEEDDESSIAQAGLLAFYFPLFLLACFVHLYVC